MNPRQRKAARGQALGKQEYRILKMIANGHSTAVIAKQLLISSRTADTHREKLFVKMGAKNAAHAVSLAYQMGVLKIIAK